MIFKEKIKTKFLNLINEKNNFEITLNYSSSDKEFTIDSFFKKNNEGLFVNSKINFDDFILLMNLYEFFTPGDYINFEGFGTLSLENNKLEFVLEEKNMDYDLPKGFESLYQNSNSNSLKIKWEITDEGIFEIEE